MRDVTSDTAETVMAVLREIVGGAQFAEADVSMARYTTFRCGGRAKIFARPQAEEALLACIRALSEADFPYFLLGNGSNVIVRDGGFDGAVLSTVSALGGFDKDDSRGRVRIGAGEILGTAAKSAADAGLSGFEFGGGIPGTVGGAVYMNAGAYGDDISGILREVRAWHVLDDKCYTLTNADCDFGYRNSLFQREPFVILDADFELSRSEPSSVRGRMNELAKKRAEKQPLSEPSAGSYFKRPEGGYAGQLIEEAGLKGFAVGGAMVSAKHAGFLVNRGGAKTSDVLAVAAHVRDTVFKKTGILLETEPIVIGID
ncbi:MAG: UDP-N-acetylmuramate dehydrogenase [Clostridiales Family XIII bacterium]|nr:UDP-N-acetylmuramate dehydrogenase [Clostridiales Family XIII bacterium]